MEREITNRQLGEKKRAERLLTLIKEESEGPVTYYVVDKICDKFNLLVPPLKDVIERIREEGFEALPTHFNHTGLKTNAPANVVVATIKDISRAS